MSTPIAVHLVSLAIQFLLLPLLMLVVPVAFAIAWAREAMVNLARRSDRATA